MFKVTIDEVITQGDTTNGTEPHAIKRYEQTVDDLDVQKVINATRA